MNFLTGTELLIGKEAIAKLRQSTVAIFGIGGVGSFAAEALGRCGIGNLVLVDHDIINESNINRQIHATSKTINCYKVDIMKERLIEINPKIKIKTFTKMYNDLSKEELLSKEYDYVVDAIDTISGKVSLIINCIEKDIPIISSMGAGNKLDPTKFMVADIYETKMCPLAKIIRRELKKYGIDSLKVVYSTEKPIIPAIKTGEKIGNSSLINNKVLGSISFVPSAAGLILSSVVVNDLINGLLDSKL